MRPTAKETALRAAIYVSLLRSLLLHAVGYVAGGILHIARGLVAITLGLVGLAFALHFLVAADLAGTFFNGALGFSTVLLRVLDPSLAPSLLVNRTTCDDYQRSDLNSWRVTK